MEILHIKTAQHQVNTKQKLHTEIEMDYQLSYKGVAEYLVLRSAEIQRVRPRLRYSLKRIAQLNTVLIINNKYTKLEKRT